MRPVTYSHVLTPHLYASKYLIMNSNVPAEALLTDAVVSFVCVPVSFCSCLFVILDFHSTGEP